MLATLIVAGCGSSGDVSQSGQVDYACALTTHIIDVHGLPTKNGDDPDDWSGELGPDAPPAWIESASVGALLGGMTGTGGYPADVFTGISRLDYDKVREGLVGIRDWCADSDRDRSTVPGQ